MNVKEREKAENLDFSGLVKEIRSRLGLSQQAFASKLGVNLTTVNRWENGRRKPLPITTQRIREALQEMGEDGQDLLDKFFRSRG